MWVTTLPYKALATEDFVNFAHHRWDIENDCFNELSNAWHADHCYKYDFNALRVIWLFIILAYNIFHLFMLRNVKADITAKELAAIIMAQFLTFSMPLSGIDSMTIV